MATVAIWTRGRRAGEGWPAALVETQQDAPLRATDELLALLAHELRTPLGAVLSWAELLQAHPLDAVRAQHGLQSIARNTRTLASLVDELLAILRQLVERHGGTVRVEVGRKAAEPAPCAQVLRGLRVLLVEDHADARDALVAMLERAGARVAAVGSTVEAMAVIELAPVDVLVTDIGLPHEDGYALLRRLRADLRGAATPAIALTAYAWPDDAARAEAAGFQRHVAKPVSPAELIEAVRSVVPSAS